MFPNAVFSRPRSYSPLHEHWEEARHERREGLRFHEGLAAVDPVTPCNNAPDEETGGNGIRALINKEYFNNQ